METQGTILYRSKASPEFIIFALKVMAEGLGIQSTARGKLPDKRYQEKSLTG